MDSMQKISTKFRGHHRQPGLSSMGAPNAGGVGKMCFSTGR